MSSRQDLQDRKNRRKRQGRWELKQGVKDYNLQYLCLVCHEKHPRPKGTPKEFEAQLRRMLETEQLLLIKSDPLPEPTTLALADYKKMELRVLAHMSETLGIPMEAIACLDY